MTYQIKKSTIQNAGLDEATFRTAVQDHITALETYNEHVANVEKNPEEFQAFPPPVAATEIMSAISKDLVPDYEVIDDLAVSLSDRKEELMGRIARAEQAAKLSVLPRGKRRLQGILQGEALQLLGSKEVAGDLTKLPASDRAIIETSGNVTEQDAAIEKHGATLMAEVDDLSEETIDAWAIRPFPV